MQTKNAMVHQGNAQQLILFENRFTMFKASSTTNRSSNSLNDQLGVWRRNLATAKYTFAIIMNRINQRNMNNYTTLIRAYKPNPTYDSFIIILLLDKVLNLHIPSLIVIEDSTKLVRNTLFITWGFNDKPEKSLGNRFCFLWKIKNLF